MGAKTLWIIDPWRRTAMTAGRDAILHDVQDRLIVEGTSISIPVTEIFAELDRLEKRATQKP